MSRSLRLLTAATLTTAVTAALVSLGAPAQAATYASNGQRCTKVGTAGPDRLVGTSRADVICGRGGNDTITGGGGNDVLDGGSGNDTIRGGTGNDRVYAGSGRDTVSGESGADVLDGGADADRLDGGSEADRVLGGSGADTISGSTGADRLDGGADGDTVTGSSGNDTLLGGPGDDDLLGGAGSDVVDGGDGTNWCDDPTDDRQVHCAIDLERAAVQEVRLSRTTVDVTSAAQVLVAQVHATDDTGVANVNLEARSPDDGNAVYSQYATRTSGTPRDGWWRVEVTIPRFVPASTWEVTASAVDRFQRRGDAPQSSPLAVLDDRPDLAPPVVTAFSATRTAVDVRSAAGAMRVRVRATDDASGVGEVFACAIPLTPGLYENQGDGCWGTDRTSGTALNGYWDIPFEIPRYSPSGTYAFRICLDDKAFARGRRCWTSDAEAAFKQARGIPDDTPRLPGGGATLKVTGLDQDTHAPVLESLSVTPAAVDSSTGMHRVHVAVHATDVEGLPDGGVAFDVLSEDGDLVLTSGTWGWPESGTPKDGVWTVDVDVLGGTPPGRFVVQVHLSDTTHRSVYVPADRVGHAQDEVAYTPAQAPSGGYLVVR